MNELTIQRQREVVISALVAAAEAATAKGASTEVFFATLVESAMIAVRAAEGGSRGLAQWHMREAASLNARASGLN